MAAVEQAVDKEAAPAELQAAAVELAGDQPVEEAAPAELQAAAAEEAELMISCSCLTEHNSCRTRPKQKSTDRMANSTMARLYVCLLACLLRVCCLCVGLFFFLFVCVFVSFLFVVCLHVSFLELVSLFV